MTKAQEQLEERRQMLADKVQQKKKIRYMLEKDLRFVGYENDSVDSLAYKYQEASTVAQQLRDTLASHGEFINWIDDPTIKE